MTLLLGFCEVCKIPRHPARDPLPVLAPLIALACRFAIASEAPTMELTDLTLPGTPLYDATVQLGAQPWSRIVTRPAP